MRNHSRFQGVGVTPEREFGVQSHIPVPSETVYVNLRDQERHQWLFGDSEESGQGTP
jgi:hypothetical protein